MSMDEKLSPVDHMFIGPVYRTRSPEVRAEVDRLLGLKPGHRNSNQIVVGYCSASADVRRQIDRLLNLETDPDGNRIVGPQ